LNFNFESSAVHDYRYVPSMKKISLITAIVFAWTTSAGAFLSVPPEFGKISEQFPDSTSALLPRVIHIRDVHMNYGVQKKIESLLHHFSQDSNVRLVGLEAADVELNPEKAFLSGDPEIRYQVAESLAHEGKINGVELFAIKAPKHVRITGLEDRALYQADIAALRNVVRLREETLPLARYLRERLEKLERRALPQSVYNILDHRRNLQKRTDGFLTYLHHLDMAAAQAGVEASLSDYPAIAEVFILENLERFFQENKSELDKEKKRLRANRPSADAPIGDDADLDTYLLTHSFDRLRYPKLGAYANYLKIAKGVEMMAEQLIQEMRRFEEQVMQMLLVSAREMRLVQLDESLSYAEQLMDLTLPREELDRAEKFYPKLSYKSIDEEIARIENEEGIARETSFPYRQVENFDQIMESALVFYQFARERDDAMLERFLAELGKEGTGIIVTGGFHSTGISKRLRDAQIPFAVIVPEVGEIENHESYLKAFLPFGDGSEILSGQSRAGLAAMTGSPATDWVPVFSNRISGLIRELNLATERGTPVSELSAALSGRMGDEIAFDRVDVVQTTRTSSGVETVTLRIYASQNPAQSETVILETAAGGIRILGEDRTNITDAVVAAGTGFGAARGVKSAVTAALATALLQLCNCGSGVTERLTLPIPIVQGPLSVFGLVSVELDKNGNPVFNPPTLNIGAFGLNLSLTSEAAPAAPDVPGGALVPEGEVIEEQITPDDILEIDLRYPDGRVETVKADLSVPNAVPNNVTEVIDNPDLLTQKEIPGIVSPNQPIVLAYQASEDIDELRENHVKLMGVAFRLTGVSRDPDDYLAVTTASEVPAILPNYSIQVPLHFVRRPDGSVLLTVNFSRDKNGDVLLVDSQGRLTGNVIPASELIEELDEEGNVISRYVDPAKLPEGEFPFAGRVPSLAGPIAQAGETPKGWMQTWSPLGAAMGQAISDGAGQLILEAEISVDQLETLTTSDAELTFVEPISSQVITATVSDLRKQDLEGLHAQLEQIGATDGEPDVVTVRGYSYALVISETERLQLMDELARKIDKLDEAAEVEVTVEMSHSERILVEQERDQAVIRTDEFGFPVRDFRPLVPLGRVKVREGTWRIRVAVPSDAVLGTPADQIYIGINPGSLILNEGHPQNEKVNDGYVRRARLKVGDVRAKIIAKERWGAIQDGLRGFGAAQISEDVVPAESVVTADGQKLVTALTKLADRAHEGGHGLYRTYARGFGALPDMRIVRTKSGKPTVFESIDGKFFSQNIISRIARAIKLATAAGISLCGASACVDISTLPQDTTQEQEGDRTVVVAIGERGSSRYTVDLSAADANNDGLPDYLADSGFPFGVDTNGNGRIDVEEWIGLEVGSSFDQNSNGVPDVVEDTDDVTPFTPPQIPPPLPGQSGFPPGATAPGVQPQGILAPIQFARAATPNDVLAVFSLWQTTVRDTPIEAIPGEVDSLVTQVDPQNPSGTAAYVGWRDGQGVEFAGIKIDFASPTDTLATRPRTILDYLKARRQRLELAKQERILPVAILDQRIAEASLAIQDIEEGRDIFVQFVVEPRIGIRTRGRSDGTGVKYPPAVQVEIKFEKQNALNLAPEPVLTWRQSIAVGRPNAVMLRIPNDIVRERIADRLVAVIPTGPNIRLKRDVDGVRLVTNEQSIAFAEAHGGVSLLDVEAKGLWDQYPDALAFTEPNPDYLIAEHNVQKGELPLIGISGPALVVFEDIEDLLKPGVVPGNTGQLAEVVSLPPVNPDQINAFASLGYLNPRIGAGVFPPGASLVQPDTQPYDPFNPETEIFRLKVFEPVNPATPRTQAVFAFVSRVPDGFIGEPPPMVPFENLVFMWEKTRDNIQLAIGQLTEEDPVGNAEQIARLVVSRDKYQALLDRHAAGDRFLFEFRAAITNARTALGNTDPSVMIKFAYEKLTGAATTVQIFPPVFTTIRPSGLLQPTTVNIPDTLLRDNHGELILTITVELGATEIIKPNLTNAQRQLIAGLTFDEVKQMFPNFVIPNPDRIVPIDSTQPLTIHLGPWGFIAADRTDGTQSSAEFSRTKKNALHKMLENSPRLADLWKKARTQSSVAEKIVLATWLRIKGLGLTLSDTVADEWHVQDQMNREFDQAYGLKGEPLVKARSRQVALASAHLRKVLGRKSIGTIRVVDTTELSEVLRTHKRVSVGKIPVAVSARNEVTVTPEGLRSLALARAAEGEVKRGNSGAVGFGIADQNRRLTAGLDSRRPLERLLDIDVSSMLAKRIAADVSQPPLRFASNNASDNERGIYYLRMENLTASFVHLISARLSEGDMIIIGDAGEPISTRMMLRLLELRARYPDLYILRSDSEAALDMLDTLEKFLVGNGDFYRRVRTKFPSAKKQSDIAKLLVMGVGETEVNGVLSRRTFSNTRVYIFPSQERLRKSTSDEMDEEDTRTAEAALGLQSMRRIRTQELTAEALRDDLIMPHPEAPGRAFESTDSALQNLGLILDVLKATYKAIGVSA